MNKTQATHKQPLAQPTPQGSLTQSKRNFSHKKTIPERYELQILIAISPYPELKEIAIEFVPSSQCSIMASSVRWRDMFRNQSKRRYIIFINDKKDENAMVPEQVSFNQLIGVIGHELGHILTFSQRSYMGMITFNIANNFGGYRKNSERGTDQIAIEHGLGWALYDMTWLVLTNPAEPEGFKKRKKKLYLSPHEIKRLIPQ
jgi:hypothetical protein